MSFSKDRREPISHMQFPWKIHAHLDVLFDGNGKPVPFSSSATLISRSYAITAGHSLYIPEAMAVAYKVSRDPKEIKFSLGVSEGKTEYPVSVISFMIHPKWISDESPHYDYALLRLETHIGDEAGHASLMAFETASLLNTEVNVTGYPADKLVNGFPQMYTMPGPVKHVGDKKFYYDIDTSGGQSGSGVWAFDAEKKNVLCCGIHTTGYPTANGAVRVTDEVIKEIEKWIEHLHAN